VRHCATRTEAEGSAFQRTFLGNVFGQIPRPRLLLGFSLMHLSLRKGGHAAHSRAAYPETRVGMTIACSDRGLNRMFGNSGPYAAPANPLPLPLQSVMTKLYF
jgi:hypothetical protein